MLNLKIVSPSGVLFDNSVESVMVPGTLGPFEISTSYYHIIFYLINYILSMLVQEYILLCLPIEEHFIWE